MSKSAKLRHVESDDSRLRQNTSVNAVVQKAVASGMHLHAQGRRVFLRCRKQHIRFEDSPFRASKQPRNRAVGPTIFCKVGDERNLFRKLLTDASLLSIRGAESPFFGFGQELDCEIADSTFRRPTCQASASL